MYPMNPPRAPQARHVRYSVRHQARLDVETHTKLEELAAAFPRKRSAILRYVMQWGLTQTGGWTVNMAVPSTVHTVGMLLEPELLQQVQDAAAIHGVSMAAWLREAMRRVTPEDFQESWRARETAPRSHESGNYNRKFGMRLNEVTWRTLEGFTTTFQRPAAEIIRQLIAQARPEDFPPSWQLAVQECQASHARRNGLGTREETTS